MSARQKNLVFLGGLMALSMLAHLFVIPALNMVEDESAYLQDAAQITPSFLPFREFGGTKGPLYLFALHGWQVMVGRDVEASRLFSALLHVASIPLFFALAKRWISGVRAAPYLATVLWSLSPVVVSLTSNTTHIPFELLLIFFAVWLVTWREVKPWQLVLAGVLTFAALISRATAVAFGPVFLYLLLTETGRWRRLLTFAGGFLAALVVTLAIVWPLYGWPKTAFFFNADALLIAKGQAKSYAVGDPVGASQALYLATQPLWLDSFAMTALAVGALPLLLPRRLRVGAIVLVFLILFYVLEQLESFVLTGKLTDPEFLRPIARGVILGLIMLFMMADALHIRQTDGPRRLGWLALLWLGAFFLFYKGWGRPPTPFYPLESAPMLALLAGVMFGNWFDQYYADRKHRWLVWALGAAVILEMASSLRLVPSFQYRGSIEMGPVREMVAVIEQRVPAGEVLFTAQPVFAYATGRPLLGGYTHPGWYLSERAGYMPADIRRVFLPDLPDLLQQVDASVRWIVVDWRSEDVYFNEGAPETKGLRDLLAEKFHPVARVENPASKAILLYERNEHVGTEIRK